MERMSLSLLTLGSRASLQACFGHVGPEALAGGPLGKLQEGDVINIEIRYKQLDWFD